MTSFLSEDDAVLLSGAGTNIIKDPFTKSKEPSNSNDSFKSPADMLAQDLKEGAAAGTSQQRRRRRRRRLLRRNKKGTRPELHRHSSFEMRLKAASMKRQAQMTEFLEDIKTVNAGFHESIMDFVSSDEEAVASADDIDLLVETSDNNTKSAYAESCPILSYFDSDGEDSIDLARVRRPSLDDHGNSAMPVVDDADEKENESEEDATQADDDVPVPPLTSYILALPEVISETAKREARGRTKRRRSYTRRRRERVRARGLLTGIAALSTEEKPAGTTKGTGVAAYHESLSGWYDHFSDQDIPTSLAAASTKQWWESSDEEQQQGFKTAHPDNDLGASLAAFLEEYHTNRQDYDSDNGSGGKQCYSDDAVA